jgi:CDP-L-myo-inositol myo-inositolphosphotransferase
LLAGAALFQLASIADGIDGEIARATFRSSKRGASWDSAVDAVTNAGFFIGVGTHYALAGHVTNAALAFGTIAVLLVGLFALGLRSVMNGEALNFDAVKRRFAGSPSPMKARLAAITGRDSYCFLLFVMTMIGLIEAGLMIMLAAAVVWLLVVIAALSSRN